MRILSARIFSKFFGGKNSFGGKTKLGQTNVNKEKKITKKIDTTLA